MKRDASEIAELSRLIDTALELPPEERPAWIERLAPEHESLKPALRKLLEMQPAGNSTFTLSDISKQVHAALQGAASSAESLEFKDGARVGPYELIRELGRGGMGTVWLARRTEGLTRRTVALKLPHAGMLHAEFAARMNRERDILESLAHPNIARLYDAGVTPAGQPYLALEYIEGVPINIYCDSKRLSVPARIRLFVQVLQAIQHAHSHLVIHRDLKPANILVTDAGNAVVLDFGIAKLTVEGSTADTALTQFGGRALTPDYASPEQIAGQALTTASDVYSLGVIFYELLTGERPYRLARQSAGAMEEAILGANIRRPSQAATDAGKAEARATTPARLTRTLRGDLDTIVLTAMRLAVAERYRTVDALTIDIDHYLQGRAIDARAESMWDGARRFVVRNKVAVSAGVAVVLALTVGLSATLWQARLARQQAAHAEQVKRFTLSIFENADVDSGGSASMTAVELLKQARHRIDSELKADPATAVELMTSVGYSLIGLNQLREANDVLRQAVALGTEKLGANDARTLAAQVDLGEGLVVEMKFAEAERVLESARAGAEKTGEATALVGAVRWLASMRVAQLRFAEAVTLASEAVRIGETRLPEHQERLLMEAYETLYASLRSAGRGGYANAARKAYEMARQVYPDGHSLNLLAARRDYASALVDEGQVARGLLELEEVTSQTAKAFGDANSTLAACMRQLGKGYLIAGKPLDAVKWAREAMAVLLRTNGKSPTSRAAGVARMDIAEALAAARDYENAEIEVRRAEDVIAASVGVDNPNMRTARTLHAAILIPMGRLQEAELELSALRAASSATAAESALRDLRLAQLRIAQRRFEEASTLSAGAIESLRREPRQSRIRLAIAKALTVNAESLVGLHQSAGAVPLLEEARDIYRSLQTEVTADQADVLALLEHAHQAASEPAGLDAPRVGGM